MSQALFELGLRVIHILSASLTTLDRLPALAGKARHPGTPETRPAGSLPRRSAGRGEHPGTQPADLCLPPGQVAVAGPSGDLRAV